jgi:hypothetical protein
MGTENKTGRNLLIVGGVIAALLAVIVLGVGVLTVGMLRDGRDKNRASEIKAEVAKLNEEFLNKREVFEKPFIKEGDIFPPEDKSFSNTPEGNRYFDKFTNLTEEYDNIRKRHPDWGLAPLNIRYYR